MNIKELCIVLLGLTAMAKSEITSPRLRQRQTQTTVLGECMVACSTDQDCQTGLLCAKNHKNELGALGLNKRKAYCSNVGKPSDTVCYDPTKAKASAPSPVAPVPKPPTTGTAPTPMVAPTPVASTPVAAPTPAAPTNVCLTQVGSETTYMDCDDNDPNTVDVCHPINGCQHYSGQLPDGISDNVYIFQDKPNLTDKQVGDILSWLRAEVTQVKNPYCWRQTYGRGVGKVLTDCPSDKDKIGALCYSKCPSGYSRVGFDCHTNCPADFRDDGLFCRKAEYGKFPWESCNGGDTDLGFLCRPPQPNCGALGLGDQLDLSCAKKIIIGDPTPLICASGLQEDAGLCYPTCNAGYHGVGPVCWQDCDSDQANCAAACAKTADDCGMATFDQVIAPLVVAANIATVGVTAAPTATAANAVKIGNKSYSATTKLGQAMLNAVDSLQKAASPVLTKNAKLITRIKDWKLGTKVDKAMEVADWSLFAYDVINNFVEAFATDFATITSDDIDTALNEKLSPSAAKYIKELWTRIQFDEMKEAYGWQLGSTVLDAISMVDDTGVTGLIAAYVKPICKTIVPFPTIA